MKESTDTDVPLQYRMEGLVNPDNAKTKYILHERTYVIGEKPLCVGYTTKPVIVSREKDSDKKNLTAWGIVDSGCRLTTKTGRLKRSVIRHNGLVYTMNDEIDPNKLKPKRSS